MRRFANLVVLLLVLAPLTRPAAAAPILIEFEGEIENIDDAGGWAAELGLLLGGAVGAVYRLDPEAGVIEFGDGRHGARLPSGGRIAGGTYRAGVGKEGSVLIFDDCWVGELECITGEGGDAYFVQLGGGSDSGVDFQLFIALTTTDDSALGGDLGISLLPPDRRRFEDPSFLWLLTDGVRTSEVRGTVVSLRPVHAPSTFALVFLGLALVTTLRHRRA